VVESISQPLLAFVGRKATEDACVRVLNDTVDYHRFFSATTIIQRKHCAASGVRKRLRQLPHMERPKTEALAPHQ
jgi:hypothetical protein